MAILYRGKRESKLCKFKVSERSINVGKRGRARTRDGKSVSTQKGREEGRQQTGICYSRCTLCSVSWYSNRGLMVKKRLLVCRQLRHWMSRSSTPRGSVLRWCSLTSHCSRSSSTFSLTPARRRASHTHTHTGHKSVGGSVTSCTPCVNSVWNTWCRT